jgi:hypothetical protein
MKAKLLCLTIAMTFISLSVRAADLDTLGALTQPKFQTLSKDLTAALSYKAVAPAEPLGITGFDIGIEVTGTSLKSADIWKEATGSSLSTLPLAKIHAHKGLPFGIDLGAVYSTAPGSNIKLMGGELRYAIVQGNVALPAVGIRAAMTKLSGVDQLEFSSKSVELSVSKGFAMLTPYIGVGQVWSTSTPQNIPLLTEEKNSVTKLFVGTNINLGLINFAGEFDKTGDNNSYSLKVGLRF